MPGLLLQGCCTCHPLAGWPAWHSCTLISSSIQATAPVHHVSTAFTACARSLYGGCVASQPHFLQPTRRTVSRSRLQLQLKLVSPCRCWPGEPIAPLFAVLGSVCPLNAPLVILNTFNATAPASPAGTHGMEVGAQPGQPPQRRPAARQVQQTPAGLQLLRAKCEENGVSADGLALALHAFCQAQAADDGTPYTRFYNALQDVLAALQPADRARLQPAWIAASRDVLLREAKAWMAAT